MHVHFNLTWTTYVLVVYICNI